MSKWEGGKGSKQRPTDRKKFDDSWDRIFGKKKIDKQEEVSENKSDKQEDNNNEFETN